MSSKRILILIMLLALIATGITMIIFAQYKIKASITIPMKIRVSDKIGLTVNTTILDFGKARPGDKGIRIIEMKNTNNAPVKAHFFPKGEIKQWVKKEPIYLNKHEAKNITISAQIPKNTKQGEYEGVLRIILKKT